MAVLCPNCSATVDQDFGLANCPQCASLLSIDMEGNVSLASNEPLELNSTDDGRTLARPQEPEVNEPVEQLSNQPNPSPAAEFALSAPASEISIAELQEEMTQFGNHDASSGPISYTVTVQGVDLGQVRQQLQAVISDPHFGWDAKELMKKLHEGSLVFENINPGQAVMLLRRLESLPVQISWRQNIYA